MANQFLSLSLFLMLLAFFIILNASSSFVDSKSVPILNSLSIAFTGQPSNKVIAPSNEPTQDPLRSGQKEGDALQELEGLFTANIAGFKSRRNRFGTVMHVSLPIGEFENAINFDSYDADVNIDEKGAFLTTFITLLRAQERDVAYRMDMVLNTQSSIETTTPQKPDLMQDLRRVTNLAKTLENRGLPKNLISAGLKTGEQGSMDLYFYRYAPLLIPEEDIE